MVGFYPFTVTHANALELLLSNAPKMFEYVMHQPKYDGVSLMVQIEARDTVRMRIQKSDNRTKEVTTVFDQTVVVVDCPIVLSCIDYEKYRLAEAAYYKKLNDQIREEIVKLSRTMFPEDNK